MIKAEIFFIKIKFSHNKFTSILTSICRNDI